MVIYRVDVRVLQGREENFRRASEITHKKLGNSRLIRDLMFFSPRRMPRRETAAAWTAGECLGRLFKPLYPGPDAKGW